MWGSFDDLPKDYIRGQERYCEHILLGLVGNSPEKNLVDMDHGQVITGRTGNTATYGTKAPYIDFVPQWDNISEINVSYYRVNAYNFKKAEYTVNTIRYLNMAPTLSLLTRTIKNPSDVLSNKGNVNEYFYKNK